MNDLLHVALPQVQALLVVLTRVAGILAAWPLLGSRAIPVPVKAGVALMLALVLLPFARAAAPPDDALLLGAGLTAEFLVGLTIGLATRALFAGIEMAGELIGTQMGLGVVQLVDPASAQQLGVIGQLVLLLASLLFLSLDGHLLVVDAIATSLTVIPPFGARLPAALVEDVLRVTQGLFLVALKLAAPVMATLLVVNLVLAALGRAVAQINVFLLSFPITIAGGLLVAGAALPFAAGLIEAELVRLADTVHGLIRGLGDG
ncbi:flagellar biosynthetic protein FliR [Nitrospira sp. Kam-Ns4a]